MESITVRDGSIGDMVTYETEDEVEEVAEYLNAFRYNAWFPDIPIPRTGWSYAVGVRSKEGEYDSFVFTPYWILVKGVHYQSNDAYFEWLIGLVEN